MIQDLNQVVCVGVSEVRCGALVEPYVDRENALHDVMMIRAGRLTYDPTERSQAYAGTAYKWCITQLKNVVTGLDLREEEREMISILGEECAEVQQVLSKIQRFGIRENPWNNKNVVCQLEEELGDVVAAMLLLGPDGGLRDGAGIISIERVFDCAEQKLCKYEVPDGRLRRFAIPDRRATNKDIEDKEY